MITRMDDGRVGVSMTLRWQMLGNGQRVYNPVMMRFHSPDNLSPFDQGGINAFAYCGCDPIDRVDPSGHSFLAAGFLLGVAAVASISAAAELGVQGKTDAMHALLGVGSVLAVVALTSGVAGALRLRQRPSASVLSNGLEEGEVMISRGSDRTVLALHGEPFVSSWGADVLNGKQLADRVAATGTGRGYSGYIDFQSCYSGSGGPYSQAQLLADTLRVKVKGYVGPVTNHLLVRALGTGSAAVMFSPQRGAARHLSRRGNAELHRRLLASVRLGTP